MPPKLSIIIPTFDRCAILRKALGALIVQESVHDFEILVISHDDASDDTPQMVQELNKQSRIAIRFYSEPGYDKHYAVNTGFKKANGDILALIDDDILVPQHWVKSILAAYESDDVNCAGGAIRIKWVNGSPPKWLTPYLNIFGQISYGEQFKELKTESINAGNFTIRRSVAFRVKGYNPCNALMDKLIGDGETGLVNKVRDCGLKVHWIPEIECQHVQDASKVSIDYVVKRFSLQGATDAYTLYRMHRWDQMGLQQQALNYSYKAAQEKVLTDFHSKETRQEQHIRHLFNSHYFQQLSSSLCRLLWDQQQKEFYDHQDWLDNPLFFQNGTKLSPATQGSPQIEVDPMLSQISKHYNTSLEQLCSLLDAYLCHRWKGINIDESAALYGAGKHTKKLLEIITKNNLQPPAFIIDDNPKCATIRGVKVIATKDVETISLSTIILSSDVLQKQMRMRCEHIFRAEVEIIDLYAGLPQGPFLTSGQC
ncbi:hypothetical protein BVX99_02075 [bacterium F16]|nr:hypothetical protein BVX99_02075 [bacterium F16]